MSQQGPVHAALRVSVVSAAWTVVSGAVAVALGLAAHTVVLVAFGAVGLLDALGSATLAHHFSHGLRHGELADHLEELAHRVVRIGLAVVGVGAIVAGALRLLSDTEAETSLAGSLLAAASLVVLLVLARRKRAIAAEVGSPALRSDAHLSMVGAAQAAVALAGIVTAAIGLEAADPIAAMAVGAVAVAVSAGSGIPSPAP